MQHDRSLLVVEHSNEMEAGRARLVELEALLNDVKVQLVESSSSAASSLARCTELEAQIKDLDASHLDLNSCVTAASERIGFLEEEAQKADADHEAKLRNLAELHAFEMKEAGERLANDQAEGRAALALLSSQAEAEKDEWSRKLLEASSELNAERDRSKQFVLASIEECQGLSAARADLEGQVSALQSKVNEAAGALKAKEELKEERWVVCRSRDWLQILISLD